MRIPRPCLVAFLASLLLACSAQDSASSDKPKPEPAAAPEAAAPEKAPGSTDDAVYALGYSLAHMLDRYHLSEAELETLDRGLRDGLLKKPSAVPEDQFRADIQELGKTRTEAAAKAERAASEGFLAKEAAAPGATKTDSGLIIRVIKPGEGPKPQATDTVRVHYTGTLRDGTVFDSSVERGQPAVFPLNRVIPCWTEALEAMQVGEKAHITCPADIAYGDRGAPPRIEPGAALAFDVELLEIVPKPAAAAKPAPEKPMHAKPATPEKPAPKK
jgi:FKBP-type peptidyl-prolyl cis-trans isomerase